MTLEHKILRYLKEHDGRGFVDVSMIEDDYNKILDTVEQLKGRNLVTAQRRNPVNMMAFGLNNRILDPIKIKINARGREYLFQLDNPKKGIPVHRKKKKFWRRVSFFS